MWKVPVPGEACGRVGLKKWLGKWDEIFPDINENTHLFFHLIYNYIEYNIIICQLKPYAFFCQGLFWPQVLILNRWVFCVKREGMWNLVMMMHPNFKSIRAAICEALLLHHLMWWQPGSKLFLSMPGKTGPKLQRRQRERKHLWKPVMEAVMGDILNAFRWWACGVKQRAIL